MSAAPTAAELNALDSAELRMVVAHAAGILSSRDGGWSVAKMLRRIADSLLKTPRPS